MLRSGSCVWWRKKSEIGSFTHNGAWKKMLAGLCAKSVAFAGVWLADKNGHAPNKKAGTRIWCRPDVGILARG
jgi:predicted secreted protein